MITLIMEAVAARLQVIGGLRVHPSPPGSVVPPAAIVSYPENIAYDQTYGRGMTKIGRLQVWVVVGKVVDRAARDRLSGYVSEVEATSVKLALEAPGDAPWDDLHVESVDFDVYTEAGVDYMAAGFNINMTLQGGTT